jgi:hypothetical protein
MSAWTLLPLSALALGCAGLALRRGRPGPAAPSPGETDPPGDFPLRLTPDPDPVVLAESSRYLHLEIVGSSGTGKNYHGLLPMIHQDLAAGAGLVVLDPKGAMRARIESYAYACGRAKELHILDLGDPAASGRYNPFLGDDPSLVAERVHSALFSDDATATSFYRDTALNLFQLFFSQCRALGVLPTPLQLRSLALDQAALARFADLDPRSRESRELRRGLLRQTPLEYARNLQGVVNALTPVTTGPFGLVLNTTRPGIDLGSILAQGEILYAGLASDQYPSVFKKISTLLLMDIQSSMTRRYRGAGRPVFLYLDEFADLLYPEVRALVAKAREARVGIILAHQSLGDLQRRGPAIAGAIFENTSNKVLLRSGSAESALTLARLSGSAGLASTRAGEQVQGGGIFGERLPRSAPASREQGHVFHPNDLLNLAVGEAFLVLQRSRRRDLLRSRLLSAPPMEPLPSPLPDFAPREGEERPALDLGDASADGHPGLKPGTPAAREALALLRKGPKRGA